MISAAFGLALTLMSAEVTTATTAVAFSTPAPIAYEAPSLWRKSFLLLSTGRYQYDNGDRTAITQDDPNNPGQEILNERYDPTGEDFYDLTTTIGGEIGYGPMQLALRFDTALYFHEPIASPNANRLIRENLIQRYDNVYNLDYISASYSCLLYTSPSPRD